MQTISPDSRPQPPAIIRRLWWTERGQVADHLLRLSERDRYLRFGGRVADASVHAHVHGGDAFGRHFIGAFVDGVLRGVAEFALVQRLPRPEGELAFSVEAAWQGLGIGTELFRRMLVFARNRGVGRVFIVSLPSNRRMRHIAAKFRLDIRPAEGEMEGRLELVSPDYLSVLEEAVGESGALLQASFGPPRTPTPPEAGADEA